MRLLLWYSYHLRLVPPPPASTPPHSCSFIPNQEATQAPPAVNDDKPLRVPGAANPPPLRFLAPATLVNPLADAADGTEWWHGAETGNDDNDLAQRSELAETAAHLCLPAEPHACLDCGDWSFR